MISAKELNLVQAQEQFHQMCEFLAAAFAEGQRIDQVERGLFPQAMTMCLEMLRSFVASHGDGDEGETISREGETFKRLPERHIKRYLSIFGELMIIHWVYGTREGQAIGWSPLDAALGLPAGENSYVLEDWLQRLCIHDAFGESVKALRAWLGTTVSVRTAEHMNREISQYVEGFRESEGVPPLEEEAELLVVTADGKGVPMRRTLEDRLREESEETEDSGDGQQRENIGASVPASPCRSKSSSVREEPAGNSGERPGKKQMSYVGAVYSLGRFPRAAEDVVEEVRRRKRATERPEPQHKHVWAQMTKFVEGELLPAAPELFLGMAVECYQRNPHYHKPVICVMDGERSLWKLQEEWFPKAVGILDLFHALKRLWAVAHCFHAEESPEAEKFVTHHLRLLLQGKVGYVLRNFRQLLKKYDPKGARKKTVQAAIRYYENNRQHMHYDEYLAAGYPIASGVAEGACKHLVKDRMERAGMRWELEGAQAMLSLRAMYLNDLWDRFIAYRIAKEQTRLYGKEIRWSMAT
jgi:hypothetical protein